MIEAAGRSFNAPGGQLSIYVFVLSGPYGIALTSRNCCGVPGTIGFV
jgi:hypothetical protein